MLINLRVFLSVFLSPRMTLTSPRRSGYPACFNRRKCRLLHFPYPRMMFSGKHFGKKKLLASYRLGKSFLRYIHRAYKVIHDFDFLPRLRIPFLFGNLYSVHERIDYFLIEFVELGILIQKP